MGFLRGNAKALRQRIQMLLLPLFYQMSTKTTPKEARQPERARAVSTR
jgi:hypothetical protein